MLKVDGKWICVNEACACVQTCGGSDSTRPICPGPQASSECVNCRGELSAGSLFPLLLSLMHPANVQELEIAVSGSPTIDIKALKKHTTYHGWSSSHVAVRSYSHGCGFIH